MVKKGIPIEEAMQPDGPLRITQEQRWLSSPLFLQLAVYHMGDVTLYSNFSDCLYGVPLQSLHMLEGITHLHGGLFK